MSNYRYFHLDGRYCLLTDDLFNVSLGENDPRIHSGPRSRQCPRLGPAQPQKLPRRGLKVLVVD